MAEVWDAIEICVDCAMLAANGEMCGDATEEEIEQHVAAMERHYPSDRFVIAVGDPFGFSWSHCQGCGSTLGGDRFGAAVLTK